LEIAAFLDSSS